MKIERKELFCLLCQKPMERQVKEQTFLKCAGSADKPHPDYLVSIKFSLNGFGTKIEPKKKE